MVQNTLFFFVDSGEKKCNYPEFTIFMNFFRVFFWIFQILRAFCLFIDELMFGSEGLRFGNLCFSLRFKSLKLQVFIPLYVVMRVTWWMDARDQNRSRRRETWARRVKFWLDPDSLNEPELMCGHDGTWRFPRNELQGTSGKNPEVLQEHQLFPDVPDPPVFCLTHLSGSPVSSVRAWPGERMRAPVVISDLHCTRSHYSERHAHKPVTMVTQVPEWWFLIWFDFLHTWGRSSRSCCHFHADIDIWARAWLPWRPTGRAWPEARSRVRRRPRAWKERRFQIKMK